jgi:hypothetical protein
MGAPDQITDPLLRRYFTKGIVQILWFLSLRVMENELLDAVAPLKAPT